MQRGEERRKQENDELVAQIRRELDSDNGDDSADEVDIGRRTFGAKETTLKLPADLAQEKRKKKRAQQETADPVVFRETIRQEATTTKTHQAAAYDNSEPVESAPGAAGAWSRVPQEGRKSKKASKTKAEELDLSNVAMLAATKKPSRTKTAETGGDDSSDDEDTIHLPMAIRDQELIKRAFAGEDVVGEFEREKHDMEVEDDDKEIDNTLPGWGGWVGEGVSNREKKRHVGRYVTKVDGVKKQNRQDYKLKDVIISEKRVKKVCLFYIFLLTGLIRRWLKKLTSVINRTTCTWPPNCLILLSLSSSMSVRCGFQLGPNG